MCLIVLMVIVKRVFRECVCVGCGCLDLLCVGRLRVFGFLDSLSSECIFRLSRV